MGDMQSHATEEASLAPPQGLVRLAGRLAVPGDADDLVQSAMVRALEFDGDIREREAWLRRVLVNERWMQLRADRRRESREQAVAANDPPVDLEQVMQCLEVARIIGRLVDELDDATRQVIRARYFDDESAADIARRQGVPAGTVRWRLKTGLDRLRAELDARHGGRRALWAGVFGPTLGAPAASGLANAGDATVAAAKGTKMFGIKMMVGVALAAGAVSGASVALIRSSDDDATTTTSARAVAPAAIAEVAKDSPTVPDPVVVAKAGAPATRERLQRPAWEARRREIRQAHAVVDDRRPAAAGAAPELGSCGQSCLTRLIPEITSLAEQCRELVGDSAADVSMTATIIGAPDIGTIVESVELVGGGDVPEELRECLTETMYTMDLGPAEGEFEEQIEMRLSTLPADGAVGDWSGIDPAAQKQIEAAIAEATAEGKRSGKHEVRAIHLDHAPDRAP